jgi:hypothetical protein
VKKKLEAFLDLNLDLSNSAQSVEETLENYITIENINDFKCEHCKKDTEARKQLTINQVGEARTRRLEKGYQCRRAVADTFRASPYFCFRLQIF